MSWICMETWLVHCTLTIISPRACARDKAIGSVRPSVCQHKNHQFWTARYLSDLLVQQIHRNCRKSGFELFSKAHEHRKCYDSLATPIDSTGHALSAHAHNLAQYVGKDHRRCSFQIDMDDADATRTQGICSIEI
jgi:hypothetical protein